VEWPRLYVVGGAAIAVTVYDERRTLDVDAVVPDRTVLDEARLLAESEGIPPTWLNENARPWASSSSSWACPMPTSAPRRSDAAASLFVS